MQKKISDISGFVEKTNYNAKVTEIEKKIPSITGLVTTVALTAVENKMPNVSNLVKKNQQILTQKYQTLNLNILLCLITINLLFKQLMQN